MIKRKKTLFCLLAGIMILTGCSSASSTISEQTDEKSEQLLFENIDVGIKIYETSDWTLEQEVYTENLNATFQYETLKAIVSIVPSEKTMEQIKQELQLNDGLITVLNETDTYYSIQTNQKESIRSDLFIEHDHGKTLILTFMSPSEDFESYYEEMEQFKENIKLYN
ncbi:hypothetical protein [Alkalihalobacterium alkalinitrilicum]|uniref:hypothetical protein n=1 Tax=Alkalihalobacterium alkalinitrilicum TaxID=427920 RepID=UPI000995C8BC|nr:hypothetical protein [Alkalihalobacterium alkalinitrilicum]